MGRLKYVQENVCKSKSLLSYGHAKNKELKLQGRKCHTHIMQILTTMNALHGVCEGNLGAQRTGQKLRVNVQCMHATKVDTIQVGQQLQMHNMQPIHYV